MTEAKSVTLFCREASADKEYQLHLEQEGPSGFLVNFAFGRRGTALKQGTKTQSPVSLNAATKIYEKILREKQAKGYTEAESGQRYVGTDLANRDSGLSPQLPTAINPIEVNRYEQDDDWFAQEKFDGQNRMITVTADEVGGVNRRGLTCPVPAHWNAADLQANNGRHVLCGEDMGADLIAFDIVEKDGQCIRHLSALERHATLMALTSACGSPAWLKVAPIATTTAEKKNLLAAIIDRDGEGTVYKNKRASFDGGRSLNSVKHKIQESSTFVVAKVNDQRSVQIALNDGDQLIPMGNVTVPANYAVPNVGALVEVEYMYRFEGGALMQPKYKGERTDIVGPVTVDQIRRIKTKAA